MPTHRVPKSDVTDISEELRRIRRDFGERVVHIETTDEHIVFTTSESEIETRGDAA